MKNKAFLLALAIFGITLIYSGVVGINIAALSLYWDQYLVPGLISGAIGIMIGAWIGDSKEANPRENSEEVPAKRRGDCFAPIDVFDHQEDPRFEKAAKAAIHDANWVKILVHRGGRLNNDSFWRTLRRDEKHKPIHYLCPDPDGFWPEYRKRELQGFLPVEKRDDDVDVSGKAKASIEELWNAVESRDNIKVRVYDNPCLGIFIITDKVLFFHPLSDKKRGENMEILLYKEGSLIYDFFLRCFKLFWDKAESDWDGTLPLQK